MPFGELISTAKLMIIKEEYRAAAGKKGQH
jgi:hypothetical protein